MNVWLYARLSRDEDSDMNSLNNQRRILLEYAERNGHTVVGESSDDNISGMHFNRPGIDAIYAAVEEKRIGAVIVKDLSRLGRHRTQTALFIDYLRENDVRVLSATENIDTGNEDDELIIGFKGLVEPLRMLFKDEVRALGESLGIAHELVWRQPFPGPGLAIRVLGEVTEEKLAILRQSDYIFRQEIAAAGLAEKIWQYFTVFTGMRSVGVMGDLRTYDYAIGVRAVTSTDAMTVEWAEIPFPVLRRISERIIGEVPHVNRVVYDITSKPPGTIEWE